MKPTTLVRTVTAAGKFISLASTVAAMLPPQWGFFIFAASSIFKEVALPIADWLDDGKRNNSIKLPKQDEN
jgi:hypothetical protein